MIAFADDLMVLTKGACKHETKLYANQNLKKTERWATENNIKFNDKITKVFLYQGNKRRYGS